MDQTKLETTMVSNIVSSSSSSLSTTLSKKKNNSKNYHQLPVILKNRETDPFRISLKKNIMDSLSNGYYIMNSDCEIYDIFDHVTSLQIDPFYNKL